jgi:hypothetical protein
MKKAIFIIFIYLIPNQGSTMVIDNLENPELRKWIHFTDRVMGGISSGRLRYLEDGNEKYYKMTGDVSTEKNGGFIQFATEIEKVGNNNFEGVRMRVRGNGENYQLHLRTRMTKLPWQYYSQEFSTTEDWRVIELPFNKFKKSNFYQPRSFKSNGIKSIGIVAIGKDFEAEIDLAHIEFF